MKAGRINEDGSFSTYEELREKRRQDLMLANKTCHSLVKSSGSNKEMQKEDLRKDTKGKLRLTLVPRKIITAIAKVREYGNMKYKTSDSWKLNTAEQYREAAFRHFLAYLDAPDSVDEESGLPHLHHLATNIAFLIEGGFKGE